MLAILEYKAGNQTSVRRALEHLGIPCRIADAPSKCAARGLYAIMQTPEKYDAAVLCHSRRGSWR